MLVQLGGKDQTASFQLFSGWSFLGLRLEPEENLGWSFVHQGTWAGAEVGPGGETGSLACGVLCFNSMPRGPFSCPPLLSLDLCLTSWAWVRAWPHTFSPTSVCGVETRGEMVPQGRPAVKLNARSLGEGRAALTVHGFGPPVQPQAAPLSPPVPCSTQNTPAYAVPCVWNTSPLHPFCQNGQCHLFSEASNDFLKYVLLGDVPLGSPLCFCYVLSLVE